MTTYIRENYEELIKADAKDIALVVKAIEKRMAKGDFGNKTQRLFSLLRSFTESALVTFQFLPMCDRQGKS